MHCSLVATAFLPERSEARIPRHLCQDRYRHVKCERQDIHPEEHWSQTNQTELLTW